MKRIVVCALILILQLGCEDPEKRTQIEKQLKGAEKDLVQAVTPLTVGASHTHYTLGEKFKEKIEEIRRNASLVLQSSVIGVGVNSANVIVTRDKFFGKQLAYFAPIPYVAAPKITDQSINQTELTLATGFTDLNEINKTHLQFPHPVDESVIFFPLTVANQLMPGYPVAMAERSVTLVESPVRVTLKSFNLTLEKQTPVAAKLDEGGEGLAFEIGKLDRVSVTASRTDEDAIAESILKSFQY